MKFCQGMLLGMFTIGLCLCVETNGSAAVMPEQQADSEIADSCIDTDSSESKEGISDAMRSKAEECVDVYVYAVNYEYREPKRIYDFLTKQFKKKMTAEAFSEAFAKERSYPYLTPLYLSDPVITFSEDGKEGSVTCIQAARLPGMTYTFGLVYEQGNYSIDDWEALADGSYLEKFENIPYSLDWYYDMDAVEKEERGNEEDCSGVSEDCK